MASKSRITPQQQFGSRPVRLTEHEPVLGEDGVHRVTVDMQPGRWLRAIGVKGPLKKTFELDEIGLFVWSRIDGRTTVKQLIDALAREYDLSPRVAEVSMMQFMKMLTARGLVGMRVPKEAA